MDEGIGVPFQVDEGGILGRTAEGHPQVVIPQSLQSRVLHMAHHAKAAGHPGGRKLYYTLRRSMYWPTMSMDCYATVRACVSCARNRVKLRRNSTEMKLFPATRPFECVAIDILGELIRAKRGKRFLLVITDRFTKLVRTVPLAKISARSVAVAFATHWVFVYGPP